VAELAKMFDLEDTYWWFVARRELVRDLLLRHRRKGSDDRILDVGCGTGATLKMIDDLGAVIGIDASREALRFCRARGLHRLAQASACALPAATGSADVVLALDLLEHIEDDRGAVGEFARVLRPGGLLIATVPALPQLWSEHDEALGHVRRYRAAALRRTLRSQGFRIERLSHLITGLLVPIAVLRLLQRLLPRRRGDPQTAFILPPRPVNRLLTSLLRAENLWLSRFDLPVGVSLVVIASRA
jgi:SAM-dependent methyltransferase